MPFRTFAVAKCGQRVSNPVTAGDRVTRAPPLPLVRIGYDESSLLSVDFCENITVFILKASQKLKDVYQLAGRKARRDLTIPCIGHFQPPCNA